MGTRAEVGFLVGGKGREAEDEVHREVMMRLSGELFSYCGGKGTTQGGMPWGVRGSRPPSGQGRR